MVNDDINTRVNQGIQSIFSNIDDYFGYQGDAADPQILVLPTGSEPSGNRSALEIVQGLFGGTPAPAPPATPAAATANASPYPTLSAASLSKWILPALAVGGVYFWMHRK